MSDRAGHGAARQDRAGLGEVGQGRADARWPDLRFADEEVRLPVALFQVDALIGYGWNPAEPNLGCYIRRHQTRRFADADRVTGWVENLHRLPSHHRLISVHRTVTDWRAVDLAELPDPIRYDPSEEDWQ